MRNVWKFPLDLHHPIDIEVPAEGIVRHVGVDPAGDPSMPCLWIEVDYPPAVPRSYVERRFVVVGTGHPFADDLDFFGSVVTPVGLVWHVYEATQP
jgi:hypothetical protein